MDFQKIFDDSSKELESIRVRKAQLKENIDSLATSLGLDPSKDLVEQAKALKATLEEKQKALSAELDELTAKLKELKQ